MKKYLKVLSLFLCASICLSCFTGCANSSPSNNSASSQGNSSGSQLSGSSYKEEIALGMINGITMMNPQETNLLVDKEALLLTHNTLVFLGEDNKIEPGLAENYKMTDSVTWEFNLRRGVKFHNGEELKASDVVFTFNKAMQSAVTSGTISQLQEITAVDDYTVRMILSAPNVDWLSILYDTRCSIVNEKAIAELGEDEGSRIGTGPYKFVELVLNDHLTVEKFDEAWEADQCPTKRFVFKCIPENAARLIALQTGEIDVCTYPSATEVSHIEDDPRLKLVQLPSNGTIYFGFNCKDPIMSNPKCREAISYAINRDEIVLIAVDGLGTPTRTWWASSISSRYDGFGGHTFDLDAAKACLVEAGYPNGFDLKVSIVSDQRAEAEVIQSQLKQINVNVSLDEMDSSGFGAYLSTGEHQAWIWGYNFSSYSDNMKNAYYTGLTGSNRAQYSNAEIDELFDKAAAETDESVRNDYYKRIQEIAAADCPILPLYYQLLSIGVNANLDGIQFRSDGNHDFKRCFVLK